MRTVPTLAVAALAAAALAGCSSHSKAAAEKAPTSPVSVSASDSASSPTSSPTKKAPRTPPVSAKGAPSNLDACQLVTQQEASSMTHASFGPGKEEGDKDRKECVYGA